MSDVIISGDVAVRKPPPSIEVELPAPVAPAERLPQGEDVVTKRLPGEPIIMDESGDALRKEIRREREPDRIYEWKGRNLPIPGESESHDNQIRRASQSMTTARRAAAAEELTKSTGGYISPEVAAAAVDATVDAPPLKVLPVADAGPDGLPAYPIEALRDDQPITEDVSFKNLNEAKRAMSNFRDAQERYQQELIAQFSAKQEQDAKAAADLERITQQQARPPQPPQPDPGQIERARLDAQQRQVQAQAYWNQLAESEREAATEMVEIQNWLPSAYTQQELRNPALIQDPARRGWLATAVDKYNGLQQGLQNAHTVRAAAQTQAAAVREHQIAQWGAAQDTSAEASIKQEMPEFNSDAAWKRLQQATRRALRESTGLSDQDLSAHWNAGRWRSVPEQKMLARLGRDQLAREGMKSLNAKRAYVPPVAPGNYQPARGAGDVDLVANPERQLADAPNQNAALKIAAKLTQAKRALGGLQP